MRLSILFFVIALIFGSAAALAKDSDFKRNDTEPLENASAIAENDEALVLEGVEVFGGPSIWQDAMRAFNAGEYEVAERKFRSYSRDVGQAVRLELGTGSGSLSGSPFSTGVDGSVSVNRGPLATDRTDGGSRIATRRRGSNANVGVQAAESSFALANLWIGMSQIRQGKLDKAKRSLTIAIQHDHTLHDARMRLGLINLLQEDLPRAERRLSQLENWCETQGCDQENALGTSYRTLANAIETYKAIKAS